jgi:hypothetical protein
VVAERSVRNEDSERWCRRRSTNARVAKDAPLSSGVWSWRCKVGDVRSVVVHDPSVQVDVVMAARETVRVWVDLMLVVGSETGVGA